MKRVHFLASKDQIINYTLAPVRANRASLFERGLDIKIFYKNEPALIDCDILCLISKPTHRILGDKGPVYDEAGPIISLLRQARSGVDKIVWMDDSDSTGVTHFELLPHIDLYLKKQLFKDKSLYSEPFYGGRIFSDYYHRKFNVVDDEPFHQFYPLQQSDWDKVRLSWNIGLGDMGNAFTLRNLVNRYFPDYVQAEYNVRFVSPDAERPVDVFLRTSADLGRNTISFHRQEMVRKLKDILSRHSNMSGMIGDSVFRTTQGAKKHIPSAGGKLPMKTYRDIMAHTKIAPSPFGWGELGVRDYEAFIFGSALLKPDMSHMQTWPDIFLPGETYVPIEWGFEDLDTRIGELLENENERKHIAQNGQDAYRNSISDAGMDIFCDWFVSQIDG